MKQSLVKGVHWSSSRNMWFARTPHKKYLYRGNSQNEAELKRLAYDIKPKKPASRMSLYRNATVEMVYWPATIDTFEGCDFQ